MTSKDRGHYGKKNSPDFKVNPEVVEAINKLTSKKGMPCAGAFKVVKEMNIEPRVVGATLDSLEITITNCQLGLFGHGDGKGSKLNPVTFTLLICFLREACFLGILVGILFKSPLIVTRYAIPL